MNEVESSSVGLLWLFRIALQVKVRPLREGELARWREERKEGGRRDEPVQPEETLGGSVFACRSLVLDKSLEGCGVQGVGFLTITEFLDGAGIRSLTFRLDSCHQNSIP